MKRSARMTYAIDKFGHDSSFQIALEAWRRGLTVTFVNDVRHYRISSENNTHFFSGSAIIDDDLCLAAVQICKNKAETKKLLSESNVNVQRGKQFAPSNSNEEIIRFAESFGFPVVLKPTNGYQEKGVFTNINGDDLRIFVIGDKVVSALKDFLQI